MAVNRFVHRRLGGMILNRLASSRLALPLQSGIFRRTERERCRVVAIESLRQQRKITVDQQIENWHGSSRIISIAEAGAFATV